jgi:hypothetical protein
MTAKVTVEVVERVAELGHSIDAVRFRFSAGALS